jgi:hypothetical protein
VSRSLCAAVDGASGDVVTSTDPTGGPGAWTVTNIDSHAGNIFGLSGVSCASPALCVAVEVAGSDPARGAGNVFASTNPTGGAGAWTLIPNVGSNAGFDGPSGVSCPSASLCVAVDNVGNVLTSTDPTGGPGAWTVTNVDHNGGLISVSCLSAPLCAAVDFAGDVVTSINPTGGAAAWHITKIGNDRLSSVSCASSSLCVAVDSWKGNVATSTNPTGGPGAWHIANIDGSSGLVGVSCPSPLVCVAVDDFANVLVGQDSALLPPSVGQIKAQLLRDLIPKGKAARIAALLKSHGYRLSLTALAAGKAVIAWYYTPKSAHAARRSPKPVLVATGTRKLTRVGTAKITITLTTRGNKLLGHAKHIRLTARGILTSIGRAAVAATTTITLRR